MFTLLRKFSVIPLNCVPNATVPLIGKQCVKWGFCTGCNVIKVRNSFVNAGPVQLPGLISKPERKKETVSAGMIIEKYVATHGTELDLSILKPELMSNVENVNEANFDAIFIKGCIQVQQLSLGHSYLKLLKEQGRKPNVATLSYYLKLCHRNSNKLENPEEVKRICKELLSLEVVNPSILESVILGMCATGQWRESLDLLPKLEEMQSPSVEVMDELILGAIRHKDLKVLLNLLKHIASMKKEISKSIFPEWIAASSNNVELLNALMDTLSDNEVYLSSTDIAKLKIILKTQKKDHIGTYTTVNLQTGKCSNCHTILKSVTLDKSQYMALRNAVMKKVLCGTDIFIGSTPEEIQKFLKFLHFRAPFDIVIDGMNIWYIHGSKLNNKGKTQQLLRLVNHFHSRRKRVLVVVKKHVMKLLGAEQVYDELKKKAAIFYVDNISRDDLFILYATLYSEQGAQFVSDDQMRNHAFQLKDTPFETLFWHWMRSSQLGVASICPDGTVTTRPPPKLLGVAQCANDNWHIPYDDGSFRGPRDIPNTWLCLKHSK